MAETRDNATGFYGDKPYQQKAREVLPILIRQALSNEPIRYQSLAQEVGMPNPRNLNYPLGCIGGRLEELSSDWDDEVPHIQALVVNKTTGLPGLGFDDFLKGRGEDWDNNAERRAIVREYWTKIYEYPYWDDVLDDLDLEPAAPTATSEIEIAKHGRGGGEGPDHLALKQFLSENPHLVGFSVSDASGEVEYDLPSGDSIDVVFDHAGRLHAVEVKPANAPDGDIARGLFQCVKYRAVLRALRKYERNREPLTICLALGGNLPSNLVSLRNSLNVEVYENLAKHLPS